MTSFICIFVAVVMATLHNDSNYITGSHPADTAYRLKTKNPTEPHTDDSQTPATATPAASRCPSFAPDDAAVSLLRNLSAGEKGSRLIQAGEEGAVQELQALLKAGAYVEARGRYRMTALHWAAARGHVEAVQCLLEGGAKEDATEVWHETPLHYAATNGHAGVVRLLVASSSDPDARNDRGWTPLHLAAWWGRAEAASALLEAGAGKEATTDDGETPLDLATQKKHQQLIDILK